jgi:hypothetical protein
MGSSEWGSQSWLQPPFQAAFTIRIGAPDKVLKNAGNRLLTRAALNLADDSKEPC